eukprot:g35096.t1
MIRKWEAFKTEIMRVQRHFVHVSVKGKAGRCPECWMTGEIEALVKKKKEAYEVTKKIDEGGMVNIIYVDFRKAFNKVPHGRLVSKPFEYRSWKFMLRLYRTL